MSDEPKTLPDAAPADKSGGIPWATVLKIVVAVVPILAGQTVVSDWRADAKKDDAVKESKRNTEAEVAKVKPVAFASAEEVTQIKAEMSKMAVVVQRLDERDTARRKKARGPADPPKVQAARDESRQILHAIKVRNATPNPALVPIPDTAVPAAQIPTVRNTDAAAKQ